SCAGCFEIRYDGQSRRVPGAVRPLARDLPSVGVRATPAVRQPARPLLDSQPYRPFDSHDASVGTTPVNSRVAAIGKRLAGPRGTVALRCLARGYPLPRWGNLRRTSPFSATFGFERGTPVDRFYLERFLDAHRDSIT